MGLLECFRSEKGQSKKRADREAFALLMPRETTNDIWRLPAPPHRLAMLSKAKIFTSTQSITIG